LATFGAGAYFDASHVGRGAAIGDIDNDGDLDIAINHKDDQAVLLRNDTPTKNRWIRLKLIGTTSNRDSVGARIEVLVNGRTIVRQRKGGTSMLSSNDPRVLVGLGECDRIEKLIVQWPKPNGGRIELKNVETNQQLELTEPVANSANLAN
jgi:hypothetical protein